MMVRRLMFLLAAAAVLALPAGLGAPPAAAASLAERSAPPEMAARIRALGAGFDGHVGIAVTDLTDGRTVSWNGDELFSQESVAKLWTVIAILDAVDSGRLRIDEPALLTSADLSVFHEPIQHRIGRHGYRTFLAELVRAAIVDSDNAANDFLVRRLGGTAAVREVMRRKDLTGIRAGVQQRELQAHVAGLDWRPGLDGGERLEAARSRLDPSVREASLRRYLADPEDGATPLATVRALKALYEGRLLSAQSTQRLLRLMHSTVHGEERLNGGLERGWTLAHKTGTGQHLGPLHVGTNDVGVLTAPDGHAYAAAVFEGSSTAPLIVREGLMRRVAEAIVETWQAQAGR
jgi:beta-lactamase class A